MTEPCVNSPVVAQPIAEAMPAARRSLQARVVWGKRVVTVGGDAPVRVQSMTNTDTEDAIATAIQVKELALAGSEVVRITVNTPEAAKQVPYIREQLDRMGIEQIPHQPRQRRQRRQKRPSVWPDDRCRPEVGQAGAHRRELGQFGSRSLGAFDGSQQPARHAMGRQASDV
jgi:hypothetical protein